MNQNEYKQSFDFKHTCLIVISIDLRDRDFKKKLLV